MQDEVFSLYLFPLTYKLIFFFSSNAIEVTVICVLFWMSFALFKELKFIVFLFSLAINEETFVYSSSISTLLYNYTCINSSILIALQWPYLL